MCIREEWRELVEGDLREGNTNGLSRLLSEVLGEEEEKEDVQQSNEKAPKKKVELRKGVGHLGEALSALCNGLVELSSMPKYQQEEDFEEDGGQSDDEDGLPMWLLGLLVCCKLEEGDEASIRIQVEIQSVAKVLYCTYIVLLSALSNPHTIGAGCTVTISDSNPDPREGGSQQQQSARYHATSHLSKSPGKVKYVIEFSCLSPLMLKVLPTGFLQPTLLVEWAGAYGPLSQPHRLHPRNYQQHRHQLQRQLRQNQPKLHLHPSTFNASPSSTGWSLSHPDLERRWRGWWLPA